MYARAKNFLRDDSGAGTAFSLFLVLTLLMVGGYAVDLQYVLTARTRLQNTADAAAHAALLARDTMSASDAADRAVEIAMGNMPPDLHGVTVEARDVEFGFWDETAAKFIPDANSRSGVRVTARRIEERENPVPTFLFKLVGLDHWNISAVSTFMTYNPSCLREGFVANGVVDLQSNNLYSNGFCIHSNTYVSLNSNNTFEPGTIVSMANLSDIELPNSGYKTNIGLEQALREGSWNIRIVSRIARIIEQLENFDSRRMPDYIVTAGYEILPSRLVTAANLVPGHAYKYTCGSKGNSTLTFDNNVVVDRNVIITDCEIRYNAGVQLENAILVSKSTDAKAHTAPSGLIVGRDDHCAEGGGAQLLTLGGMSFPADLHIYGGQLLAVGDIEFSANADGVEGAAMVAGGQISGTSNMNMGFCGTGTENNIYVPYFKMVM